MDIEPSDQGIPPSAAVSSIAVGASLEDFADEKVDEYPHQVEEHPLKGEDGVETGESKIAAPPAVPVAQGAPGGRVSPVAKSEEDGPSHYQRLMCPSCLQPNYFGSAQQLEMHLARAHFPCRPYPCTACGGMDRLSTEKELREHYERGHGLQKGEYKVGPLCPSPSHSSSKVPPTQIAYLPADENEAFLHAQVKRNLKTALEEAGNGGSE